jgi:Flp pilus assembly protein TadG
MIRTIRKFNRLGGSRDATAALEFALMSAPLLLVVFAFVATNALFYTWSSMQNNAQYAARLMATGQITSMANGAISTSNTTNTVACGSTLASSDVEYYACTGLPSWASFTVTVTENCATPDVEVNLSVSASSAALADLYGIFKGKTLSTQAVMMKEATCP